MANPFHDWFFEPIPVRRVVLIWVGGIALVIGFVLGAVLL